MDSARLAEAAAVLAAASAAPPETDAHARRVLVPITTGTRALLEVVRELDARGIGVQDVGIRRPTLDDAFLTLTGHRPAGGADDTQDHVAGQATATGQEN